MKGDSLYLRHILDCITRIEEDTADGLERFMASHMLQDAVLRNLQVMAESSHRLSDAIKASQATVEWRKIVAFRNVLVHDYLGIDLEAVWGITQHEVPSFKRAVLEMLTKNGDDE